MSETLTILKKSVDALKGEHIRGTLELEEEFKELEQKTRKLEEMQARINHLEESIAKLEKHDELVHELNRHRQTNVVGKSNGSKSKKTK